MRLIVDQDEVTLMGSDKVMEQELTALVTGDSCNLQTLAVPEYKPTESPNNLDTVDKRTWEDQDRFLAAFAKCRTKSTSARLAGIGRSTVYWWEGKDHLGFKDRLREAGEAFCDMLENKARDLAMELKAGQNPLILITLLNANLPDKYRPNSVVPSETMTDVLRAMKQAVREHKKLSDGSETTVETETTVIVKNGL